MAEDAFERFRRLAGNAPTDDTAVAVCMPEGSPRERRDESDPTAVSAEAQAPPAVLQTAARTAPAVALPPTHSPGRQVPLTADYPCVVCAGIVRWDDRGTLRCVVCWPAPQLKGA